MEINLDKLARTIRATSVQDFPLSQEKLNALPSRLKDYPYWLCWGLLNTDGKPQFKQDKNGVVETGEDGKPKIDKTPYNPRTGGKAQPNNPETFSTLDFALAAAVQQRHAGVGVGVFGNLGAIDIDHCYNPETGELSDMAADVMQMMDGAYTEYSPSGAGLRILFTVPEGFSYDKKQYYINPKDSPLEVYIAGITQKYVTVTGNALTPGVDLLERGAQVLNVLNKYMKREPKPNSRAVISTPVATLELTDRALLDKATAAKNGDKFRRLWNGDTSDYGGDDSAADLALCNLLAFWTQKDAGRMDSLFQQSGLMRPKWNEIHDGTHSYGWMTIRTAIDNTVEVYNPERSRTNPQMPTNTAAANKSVFVKPLDYTDAGNMQAFMKIYGFDLLYVDAVGWLYWTGAYWKADDSKPLAMAVAYSDTMLADALQQRKQALKTLAIATLDNETTGGEQAKKALEDAQDSDERTKEYLKHAQHTRQDRRLRAIQTLSLPQVKRDAKDLDTDPFSLNTPAGIVDLKTGEIRSHDKGAFCTHITAVAPERNHPGVDLWSGFLDILTCNDADLKYFLQIVTGMALIGKVYHEGIVLAYGNGRNGKSTLFNALKGVLGDYADSIAVKTLTTEPGNKEAAMERMRGKRMIVTGELEPGAQLSISALKAISSKDGISVARKYKDPETIIPTHTLFLFTNSLPRVVAADEGTWRRLDVIPFNAYFSEKDEIPDYESVLIKNAGPAILQWMIDGAQAFVKNGYKLTKPDAVLKATGCYANNEDSVVRFLEECCIQTRSETVGAETLYQAYKAWMSDRNEAPYTVNRNTFPLKLKELGFQQRFQKNRREWLGLSLSKNVHK